MKTRSTVSITTSARKRSRILLVFRLSNAFVESSWNRERIESVQITVAENLGVGTRGGYYDRSGALRDMVQNHDPAAHSGGIRSADVILGV